MLRFNQTIKNLNRIRQIIQVLVKYGFEDVVTNTTLKNLVPASKQMSWSRENRPVFEYSRWERLRMVLEELGPTFIKFAQVLSNRPDILPAPLIHEFEKLQNDVAPLAFSKVEETIIRELGKPIEEVFDFVLEKPIGAASIGQVHRARLKTGEEVVIKVQRPRAKALVETDISILREVISRVDGYLERYGLINVSDILDALDDTMQRELDYRFESKNIRQFRNFYSDRKDFYVPQAYSEFTTERMLVTAYADGCKITDIDQLKAWGLKPEDIAKKGMHIYLAQIFEFGFFHADPHPGNIIIREDGVICLIDFGMVGKLNRADKFAFAGVLIAMAQENPRKMAMSLRKLATEHEITDRRKLERELGELINDFSGMEIDEGNIGELGLRLQHIIYEHKMKVPGAVFLILRAMAILEGIAKRLSPTMNAYAEIQPYGVKILQEQYSIPNIVDEISMRFSNMDHLLRNFPLEFNDVLKILRKGELKLITENPYQQENNKQINQIADRFVLALLIGFLLIASSITLQSPNTELFSIWGMPGLSFIGYLLALILGIWLSIKSMKN